MGHPMAKKGIRKRGDKIIKHQERRYIDTERDNRKTHIERVNEREKEPKKEL